MLLLFQANVNLTYQLDNARCHVSPQSPDLNPIENLWSEMKRELDKVPIGNAQQLFAEAQRIWRHVIPNYSIPALLESLPRRFQEVLRNQGGGHTHY